MMKLTDLGLGGGGGQDLQGSLEVNSKDSQSYGLVAGEAVYD